MDCAIGFPNTYPIDSDLSDGQRYPSFEQLRPVGYYPTLGARDFSTVEDVSAFGQHQKFPPHARKTSDIQCSRLLSYQQEILLLLLQCMRFLQGNPTNQYPPLSNFIIMLSIERRISRHTTQSPGLFTLKMGALLKGKALGTRLHVTLLSIVAKFRDLNDLS